MVWSVFNYLLTQKLPRKANVALGCSQNKKLLKTPKSCSEVAEHNLFMPGLMWCSKLSAKKYMWYVPRLLLGRESQCMVRDGAMVETTSNQLIFPFWDLTNRRFDCFYKLQALNVGAEWAANFLYKILLPLSCYALPNVFWRHRNPKLKSENLCPRNRDFIL